jgi:serine phosphatase RsbU (regulator of sigma subunit)
VRYLPAAEQAEVGGDWYDAFMGPDGTLMLAVGDVTGHDRAAAAAMAQVRNLLRGVTYTVQATPADVLRALDRAMYGLAVGVYATAVLARVDQSEEDARRGVRTLRWSNAGHPPPVLVAADGRARLLEARSDALLGLGNAKRADHHVVLEPGASVVFYTDGLVERRGTRLQERFEWLTALLDGRQDLSAEAICDLLVDGLGEEEVDDDVALLVLRAYPEDAPRPAEAGPPVLPGDLRAEGDTP